MPFGLTIGTERAAALQNAIQDELIKRRYSQEPDPTMAEYITIMIINNKSSEQISSELEELIGSDFERSFTDWLFAEAAKGEQSDALPAPAPLEAPRASSSSRDIPPHVESSRRNPPTGPRSGAPLYQQALNQATLNTSPTAQKRPASARSPSPNGQGPNKTRRTDLPSGPRAMREGRHNGPAPRSLLDRVGPARPPHPNGFPHEEQMMMGGPFPPNMSEMDMNAMAAAMQQQQMGGANPLMLQEMMMSQMALMAQMASSLGILNPGMMGGGFPMQGMPDAGMFNNGPPMDGFQGHQGPGSMGRGRGGHQGRGRGGRPSQGRPHSEEQTSTFAGTPDKPVPVPTPTPQVATSTPQAPVPTPVPAPVPAAPAFAVPERPQSPTLCKFGLKCTNMQCRWSHPSPVATPESGVVLSNEPCDKGKNCKDKDCIKAHVSPAVANPSTAVDHSKSHPPPAPAPAKSHASSSPAISCRYGAQCTRPNCSFQHPPSHPLSKAANAASQPCRFGAACTRATCQYQHPEGRVLPTSFHRGVGAGAPLVNVPTPHTGSMGSASSPHKSVVFKTSSKEDIEAKIKKLQEEKSKAEEMVKAAEAASAASKKESAAETPVALAA